MTVTFHKISARESCLQHDMCSECHKKVTVENGKAHNPPLPLRKSMNNKPILMDPIHDTCLDKLIRTRLDNAQPVICSNCKESVFLSLKERTIIELKFLIRDAIAGIAIGAGMVLYAAMAGPEEREFAIPVATLVGMVAVKAGLLKYELEVGTVIGGVAIGFPMAISNVNSLTCLAGMLGGMGVGAALFGSLYRGHVINFFGDKN